MLEGTDVRKGNMLSTMPDSKRRVGLCISGRGRAALNSIRVLKSLRPNVDFFALLGAQADSELEGSLDSMSVSHHRLPLDRDEVKNSLCFEMLHNNQCDYWMLTFDHLIPTVVVKTFPERIFNLHPTVLPSYPGFHGLNNSKYGNTLIIGATCHLVDEGIDTGPVLSVFVMPRRPSLSWTQLEREFANGVMNLHLQTLVWVIDGRVVSTNGKLEVINASYDTLPYVPDLEI